ncbi:uncharacterized protein FN964_008883 [Alca torda]
MLLPEGRRAAGGDMYLLDSSEPPAAAASSPERMQRGTPQRKTVYRISVTMVKKELLGPESGHPGPELPRRGRRGGSRAPGSSSLTRAGLLLVEEEEGEEEEGEERDRVPSPCGFRNFRTLSTGQLELGRLKVPRRAGQPFPTELARGGPRGSPSPEASGEESAATCGGAEAAASPEEEDGAPGARGPPSGRSGEAPQAGERGQSPWRQPGLLRRSFSFRHWSGGGGELPRMRALGRVRRHSSSGCLTGPPPSQEAGPQGSPPAATTTTTTVPLVPPEKRNTLDVGEVLSQADPLSQLERWERSKSKNRTLDNSDLQRLSERLGREGPAAAHEHRLLRFFSGIFARKDGTSALFGSPHGRSPRSSFSRSRAYFSSLRRATVDMQSSSESINGSPHKGALPSLIWGGRVHVGGGICSKALNR